jgi:hypothetical protein
MEVTLVTGTSIGIGFAISIPPAARHLVARLYHLNWATVVPTLSRIVAYIAMWVSPDFSSSKRANELKTYACSRHAQPRSASCAATFSP